MRHFRMALGARVRGHYYVFESVMIEYGSPPRYWCNAADAVLSSRQLPNFFAMETVQLTELGMVLYIVCVSAYCIPEVKRRVLVGLGNALV